ncbi:hypothetical protein AOLI_G00028510 [Acnodon oligacanthus]
MDLVDKLCNLLVAGAFELPQWARNSPAVISHLSPHTRSDNYRLWLSHGKRGKDRRSQGLQFLRLTPAEWPEPPCLTQDWQDDEVRRHILYNLMTSVSPLPDLQEYQTFGDQLEATARQLHRVAEPSDGPTASEYADAVLDAIHQAQMDSFPSEVIHLKAGKPVPANSRLLCLAREFDRTTQLGNHPVTVQCTIDGQFVLVVARDTTLPRLSLDSISLLGGSDAPCSAVDSNADFAIYQFPVTACGTRAMELGDYVVYENKMFSSYEVAVGPLGAITRDSHYELYFQCRYADTAVAALAVQLASNSPPMPVAASGPLMVELRLGSGQCVTKGCVQAQAAYTSYYTDADYPVTKVLREPVYVEVRMLGRTDPNIALILGHCWATSSPHPFSTPQWDLLVDGCPYQYDRYLTTPIPVDGSSGLQFPSHYKRFVLKMFTFVDPDSKAPWREKLTPVNQGAPGKVSRMCLVGCWVPPSLLGLTSLPFCPAGRDVAAAGRESSHKLAVVSSGEIIFLKKP